MNFFRALFRDDCPESSKRWISITISATICFSIIWINLKYPQFITDALHSAMIFVAVMSGLVTAGQLLSIWKGTPPPPDEPKQPS